MEAKYIQEGKAVDYTPSVDVPAGTVVAIFELIGITHRDIAAGQLGALNVQGVYEVVKGTGAGKAITEGMKVYWDAANKVVTAAQYDGDPPVTLPYMGKALKAAGDNDATVTVRLDQ